MFGNVKTAGRGLKPRIAQAYKAMEFDVGVDIFLENNPEKSSALAAAGNQEEEVKREEYRPLKVENNEKIFFCRKIKNCKHACTGVKGETTCLPCLEPECIPVNSRLPAKSELCSICYTSELSEEPCVQIGCGHVYHADCVR